MRVTRIFCFLLATAAIPALAGSRPCSAGLVSAGMCGAATQQLVYFALPPAALADLEAELCDRYGYPLIVCAAADVKAGRCASSQLGQAVNTPETRGAFSSRMLGELLRNLVRERRLRAAQEAAMATFNEPAPIE